MSCIKFFSCSGKISYELCLCEPRCPDAFQAELGPVFWIAFSVSLVRIKAVGATGSMGKHPGRGKAVEIV